MTQDNKPTEQQLFDQLISSIVHSAWVFLGKIKNPMNDELERNLEQASIQIDMLDMLYKRMKGNLSDNEDQYLNHLVRELKMNFVEEKNKPTEDNMEDEKGVDKEEVEKKMEDGKGEMEDGEKEKGEDKEEGKSKKTKVEETEKENDEGKE